MLHGTVRSVILLETTPEESCEQTRGVSRREYDGLTFLESRAGAVADIQPPLPGTWLIELQLPWALAPIAFNPRAIGARRSKRPALKGSSPSPRTNRSPT